MWRTCHRARDRSYTTRPSLDGHVLIVGAKTWIRICGCVRIMGDMTDEEFALDPYDSAEWQA